MRVKNRSGKQDFKYNQEQDKKVFEWSGCKNLEVLYGEIQDYSFLYQRGIVPGEAVELTGTVSHSVRDADGDEYQSSSSADEEEFQEGKLQTLSTLSEEENFLLGRVATFGRAVRFIHRLMFAFDEGERYLITWFFPAGLIMSRGYRSRCQSISGFGRHLGRAHLASIPFGLAHVASIPCVT